MPSFPEFGTAYYSTVAGATCVSSANCNIIGVLFQSSGTGSLQIWSGTTATGNTALSGTIYGYRTAAAVTANNALWIPFPAYAIGGITINHGGADDPKLTLFYAAG